MVGLSDENSSGPGIVVPNNVTSRSTKVCIFFLSKASARGKMLLELRTSKKVCEIKAFDLTRK